MMGNTRTYVLRDRQCETARPVRQVETADMMYNKQVEGMMRNTPDLHCSCSACTSEIAQR